MEDQTKGSEMESASGSGAEEKSSVDDHGGAWGTSRYERVARSIGGSDWSRSGEWFAEAQSAKDEKKTYQEKLESADNDDIFKYVFLINNAAVEQYVNQARGQAESSFALSRIAAVAGFSLLLFAIVIGIVYQFTDQALSIAYLTGIGGALTEFIAGVFFWLYNRTLQQINIFYQGMMTQQHEVLAAIGRAAVEGEDHPARP